VAIAAVQAQREADELAGARFTPAISRRSKFIARANRRLPERVKALMERRQRKQDKLREEAQQREMAEATFRPKLSKPASTRIAQMTKRMRRRVGHLLQYDVDKQIRARQRQQIMQELESRELTFSPRINDKSVKIFRKMQHRIQALQEKLARGEELTEEEAKLVQGGMTKAARSRAEAEDRRQSLAMLEAELKHGTINRIPLGKEGFSKLPGHEEETFHPRINPRSRMLARDGGSKLAHERLYNAFTESHMKKLEERKDKLRKTLRFARTKSSAAMGLDNSSDGLRLSNVGMKDELRTSKVLTEKKAASTDPSGEFGVGYENRVPYRPGYDFLVRRVLAVQAAAEATSAAVDE
jgi:hypothetical protein